MFKQNKKFYERITNAYYLHLKEEQIQGVGVRMKTALSLLLETGGPMEGRIKRCLDIAATLTTTKFLLRVFPDAVIISQFWPSDLKAKQFREAFPERKVEVCMGDSAKLEQIPDNSIDLAFAGGLIEHIYEVDTYLLNIKRVLKPEGILIGTTPNLVAWSNRVLMLLGKCPYLYDPFPSLRTKKLCGFTRPDRAFDAVDLFDFHIRVGTPEQLVKFLRKSGFSKAYYKTTNLWGKERKFSVIRKILNRILPNGMKENICYCAIC